MDLVLILQHRMEAIKVAVAGGSRLHYLVMLSLVTQLQRLSVKPVEGSILS